jgi:hypothetical protein
MASNLESLRKLAANYWQPALGILSLVPSLLQFLGEFQKGEGLSHAKPWIYLAGGIAFRPLRKLRRLWLLSQCLLLIRKARDRLYTALSLSGKYDPVDLG